MLITAVVVGFSQNPVKRNNKEQVAEIQLSIAPFCPNLDTFDFAC